MNLSFFPFPFLDHQESSHLLPLPELLIFYINSNFFNDCQNYTLTDYSTHAFQIQIVSKTLQIYSLNLLDQVLALMNQTFTISRPNHSSMLFQLLVITKYEELNYPSFEILNNFCVQLLSTEHFSFQYLSLLLGQDIMNFVSNLSLYCWIQLQEYSQIIYVSLNFIDLCFYFWINLK